MSNTLLEVKNLSIEFQVEGTSLIQAASSLSFKIPKGKTLGLVGESGSGKSVTALSLMRLIPEPPGKITNGQILFNSRDILKLNEKEMRQLRGNKISMIFQEPMTSLNPVFTIGDQIAEALILHRKLSKSEAQITVIDLLKRVGIKEPDKRIHAYPHEFSGGQRQRAMIAMAIACGPDLLIADEPTTALDVTIQKQILNLLAELQDQHQMSILFITHDLSVVAEVADDVLVMQKGVGVEFKPVKEIFTNPEHPYTQGLLSCRPTLKTNTRRLPTISDYIESGNNKESKSNEEKIQKDLSKTETLLEIKSLNKDFPLQKNIFGQVKSWVQAVNDVSFRVPKGSTLGLVGESGCGKTTLGRTILRLIEPTSGKVFYNNQNILDLSFKEMRSLRKKMQIIFQDPYASLNPRMTVGSAIMEPMAIHNLGENKKDRLDRVVQLVEKVGLKAHMINRYPHEFSGGQRQRVCIARALAVEPEFIVCDESVSALDVSIQAQILNLLLDLQDDLGLTYIFISHDLSVVKFMSDAVLVMYKGQVVEKNSSENIYSNPQHSYTKTLLDSIPADDPF